VVRTLPLWLLLACASAGSAPVAPAREDLAPMERDVARRVNQYRLGKRLPALRFDTAVASVARAHSLDMARGRVPLGHDGFKGRANAVERFVVFDEIAENVALNDYPRTRTVAVAIDGWLHSAHHRENIEGAFDLTGVGIARSRNGTYYFTQVFVARRR
jgi:uncharacterized protein YkwD